MLKIYDGRTEFYQWDINQKLIVSDPTITEVHFCNQTEECSLVCEVYEEDGKRLVNVPNVLLQDNWPIKAYAYCDCTKASITFEVKSRSKPDDYVYTETEVRNWQEILRRLNEIELAEGGIAQVEELPAEDSGMKGLHNIIGTPDLYYYFGEWIRVATNKDVEQEAERAISEEKRLEVKIDSVERIAKGVSIARSYSSYKEMIKKLEDPKEYPLIKGQSILIATLDVPDLWIYDISTTFEHFEFYVDEHTFAERLREYNFVKVGYYTLAALETQKVDLEDYAEKGEVEAVRQTIDLAVDIARNAEKTAVEMQDQVTESVIPLIVNSDYAENNPRNKAYIKNRPFYDSYIEVVEKNSSSVGIDISGDGSQIIYQISNEYVAPEDLAGSNIFVGMTKSNSEETVTIEFEQTILAKSFLSSSGYYFGASVMNYGVRGAMVMLVYDHEWAAESLDNTDIHSNGIYLLKQTFTDKDGYTIILDCKGIEIPRKTLKKLDNKFLDIKNHEDFKSLDDKIGNVRTEVENTIQPKLDALDDEIAEETNRATQAEADLVSAIENVKTEVEGNIQEQLDALDADAAKMNSAIGDNAKAIEELEKSKFSGSYNDLTDQPTIPTVPTKVSEFENDKGYVTEDDIEDSLESTATNKPLSAKQGKVLDEKIVNADYNVNDDSSKAYILNRPFYDSITKPYVEIEKGEYDYAANVDPDGEILKFADERLSREELFAEGEEYKFVGEVSYPEKKTETITLKPEFITQEDESGIVVELNTDIATYRLYFVYDYTKFSLNTYYGKIEVYQNGIYYYYERNYRGCTVTRIFREQVGELKKLDNQFLDLEHNADFKAVESLAKHANQAISTDDYETLVHLVKGWGINEYKVGQSIYVVALEVPDLWVSAVVDSYVDYKYIDDADIVSRLKGFGEVQIGHYFLSPLETQKVDLEGYVKRVEFSTINTIPGGTDAGANGCVYGVDYKGNENTFLVAQGKMDAGTIPARDGYGNFYVRETSLDYHVVNKRYADATYLAKSNINDAVKQGLLANIELTAEEKANARELIGAIGSTDYATSDKAGLVYTDGDELHNGIVIENGIPSLMGAGANTLSDDIFSSRNEYGVAVTSNLLDKWLKIGLTGNTETWSEGDKLAVRDLLGIKPTKLYEHHYDIRTYDEYSQESGIYFGMTLILYRTTNTDVDYTNYIQDGVINTIKVGDKYHTPMFCYLTESCDITVIYIDSGDQKIVQIPDGQYKVEHTVTEV